MQKEKIPLRNSQNYFTCPLVNSTRQSFVILHLENDYLSQKQNARNVRLTYIKERDQSEDIS